MEGQEFKAFDRVLVRDEDQEQWQAALYDQYITRNGKFPHHVISGACFAQCIPYEGYEHLLGTTDSYEPERWKPKNGEIYYCIAWAVSIGFFTVRSHYSHEPFDTDAWKAGNCFRTEEEANQVRDQMNEALEGVLSPVPGSLFDREQHP